MKFQDTYEGILAEASRASEKGRYDSAIELYRRLSNRLSSLSEKVMERRPELQDMLKRSLLELGSLLSQQGDIDGAIETNHKVLPLFQDDEGLSAAVKGRAALYRISKGEAQEGLDELRGLIEEYPDERIPITLDLIRGLGYTGRYEEMEQVADECLAREDINPYEEMRIHDTMQVVCNSCDRNERAVYHLEKLMGFSPTAARDELFILYDACVAAGDLDRIYARLSSDDNTLRRQFYRGMCAHIEGDEEEARRRWENVLSLKPEEHGRPYDLWMEAALRTGHGDLKDLTLDMVLVSSTNGLTMRGWILLGALAATVGEAKIMTEALSFARTLVHKRVPRFDSIDNRYWRLFDELVPESELKEQAKEFFDCRQ